MIFHIFTCIAFVQVCVSEMASLDRPKIAFCTKSSRYNHIAITGFNFRTDVLNLRIYKYKHNLFHITNFSGPLVEQLSIDFRKNISKEVKPSPSTKSELYSIPYFLRYLEVFKKFRKC